MAPGKGYGSQLAEIDDAALAQAQEMFESGISTSPNIWERQKAGISEAIRSRARRCGVSPRLYRRLAA
jgi:hypothetical protein